MKQLIAIALLTLSVLTGCNKNEFENFEIEKSHTVTDSLLQAKYIDPLLKAEVIELTLRPIHNEAVSKFYLINKGGKFSMLGKSRQFANPAALNVSFGTSPVTATVDFTEASLFGAVISDLGQELTRGADHSYAFVTASEGSFELEGIQYGDRLTARILDPKSPSAQHILNNGIVKDYDDQEKVYHETPFIAFDYKGKPVQMVVDPFNSSVWVFYSNSTDFMDYIVGVDGYEPPVHAGITYSTSDLGDTLQFNNNVNLTPELVLKGLVWNSDRTAYTAWLQQGTSSQSMATKSGKLPFYSFTEMATFLNSQYLTRQYYLESAGNKQKIIYEILQKLSIVKDFKVDLNKVNTDPNYTKDWSPAMKTNLLKLVAKINSVSAPMKVTSFEVNTPSSFYDLGIFKLDYHIGIAPTFNFKLSDGSGTDSITYANNLVGVAYPHGSKTYYEYFGFDNPKTFKMVEPTAPENLVKVWPEFYEFIKPFDEAVVHIDYLPKSADDVLPRIKMHSQKTGDVFFGESFLKK